MFGKLRLNFYLKTLFLCRPVEENVSTDAGLLIFRQWDQKFGFTEGFSQQLDDRRCDPNHSLLEMVRSRVFGIPAGYEDQNDHDALRSDAIFKLLVNRLPDDDDLASQPTLSRFENNVTAWSLLRLEAWFIDRFVNSFEESPREVTLDIDVFDDPTHGDQQLTLFHGYYKRYQYLRSRDHLCRKRHGCVTGVVVRHGRPDTRSRRRFRTHRSGFA